MADGRQAGKMYDRCAYFNCYNGKYSTGHKLFRFPAYSDTRHHLWIRYTGNIRLRSWTSATIRRAGICGDHFSPKSFTNETHQSLIRDAVPKPYSCIDNQAKASPTLLAQIKSLPRKRKRSQKFIESQKSRDEVEAENLPQNSDEDEPMSLIENPDPTETNIVDTVEARRKIKIVKTQEQNLKLNNIVRLERCKNPETCPANPQASHQAIGKPHPHFHKVYLNKTKEFTEKSSTSSCPTNNKLTIGQSSEGINDSLRSQELNKKLDTACDETISNEPTKLVIEDKRKCNDEIACKMVPDLTNVTKIAARKTEKIRGNMKSTNEQEKNVLNSSIDNSQNLENEKSDPLKMKVPEYISKKHLLTKELIDEYNRTKNERVADRCAYMNCNKSRLTTGTHIFRFPKNADARLATWVKNAGNAKVLHWSLSTLRRSGLCGDHFSAESFFNTNRQRLIRSAVPIPFFAENDKSFEEDPIESTAE